MNTQPQQSIDAQPKEDTKTVSQADQKKGHLAFRTIGESAQILDVPQHVLRFWETKFSQIRPMKRGGGRRYYRPEDIELLAVIKDLLHAQGYTIKGVQKILRSGGKSALLKGAKADSVASSGGIASNNTAPLPKVAKKGGMSVSQRASLSAVLSELRALKAAISGQICLTSCVIDSHSQIHLAVEWLAKLYNGSEDAGHILMPESF